MEKRIYKIDLTGVDTYGEVHNRISKALSFPEYYGNNLDALHDCLTDLEDIEITITSPVEDGAVFQRVLRVFKAAAKENESFELVLD